MKNQKIETIRQILLKYFLPDCLKPEYDGMSTHELAMIILREIEGEVDNSHKPSEEDWHKSDQDDEKFREQTEEK